MSEQDLAIETPDAEPAPVQPAADEAVVEHRLQFTGSGGEYFRIWIVNLLLSILTLGIYSAWAKVRREQYFHRNTVLDGSGFDYHGNPKSIFKGRCIAFGLLAILSIVDRAAHIFYYPLLLILSPIVPWLMIRSFVFRSRNTSFRGLHFNFLGTYKEFCKTYLVPLLVFIMFVCMLGYGTEKAVSGEAPNKALMYVPVIGFLLLIPVLWHRFKWFQFNHLAFGASRFAGEFSLKMFYGLFFRYFGVVLAVSLLCVMLAMAVSLVNFGLSLSDPAAGIEPSQAGGALSVIGASFVFVYLFLFLIAPAYFQALVTNTVWNNTHLDKHKFKSNQTFWGVFGIVFFNFIFMVLTLGLYWPWAKVRIARYRAEHTAVLAAGNLDNFIAGATAQRSAYGEEIADVFDFDIGF